MSGFEPHRWDVKPVEARVLQTTLAEQVDTTPHVSSVQTIAAADVSYNRGDNQLYAAVVVVNAQTFELVERVGVVRPSTYPYVPGLLSFREAPAILEAFGQLQTQPDALICDGQGLAHPRRLGIACHVGLWVNLPTVGCGKSRLCGRHEEPGPNRGDFTPLYDGDDVIGAVLRSKPKCKPLYISPGHLINLPSAIDLVLNATEKYRLPTPIRLAHNYVNELRRAAAEGQIPPT